MTETPSLPAGRENRGLKILGLLLAVSVLSSLLAQYLFTGEFLTRFNSVDPFGDVWKPAFSVAILLIGVSMLGGAFFYWTMKPRETAEPSGEVDREPSSRGMDLVPATVLYGALLVLYFMTGETRLVRWLWVLAVPALLIPLYRRDRVTFWPAGIAGWEWLLTALCTGLGFFFRYWRLTDFPSHVDTDVAQMGIRTLEMMNEGVQLWSGIAPSGHLYSTQQVLALGMRLFGKDHYGIVMFSVIAGTLTIPVSFLLGRLLFGRIAGLIAMAFVMGSYTHIHFSRIMFGPTATFALCLAVYFLFRGLFEGKAFWMALAGLTGGLGILTYYSSRISPFLIGIVLLLWLFEGGISRRRKLFCIWACALGGLVGMGPVTGYALENPQEFAGRANDVMLWAPEVLRHSHAKYETDSTPAIVAEQVKRSFLTLYYFGDQSPHFWLEKPMVGGLVAAFFTVGLGFLLGAWRDLRLAALGSWFFLTFVLGGVLTSDPPYWPHLNIAIPAICLLAGFAAAKSLELAALISPGKVHLVYAAAAGLLLALAGHHWSVYISHVFDNAVPRIRASRFISTLPREMEILIFSSRHKPDEMSFRFFAKGHRISAGTKEGVESLAGRPGRDICFLLFEQRELLDGIVKRYPGGKYREHPPGRNPQFLSYTLGVDDPVFVPRSSSPFPIVALSGWWLLLGGLTAFAFVIAYHRVQAEGASLAADRPR